MKAQQTQNYINHIVFVLDASSSMGGLERELIKVADNQIAYLAQRSKELDQETRITVYKFSDADEIECLIYDKDVLRMPSIAGLYRTQGVTALIDATLLAIKDLGMTPEKYGEHSFLIYVLTDGQENDSRASASTLSNVIDGLPDHWTLAVFVPDQLGVREAKSFGFPKDNIAVWDATTNKGVNEAGERIKQTTEAFMQNRAKGIRGSKNLFTLNTPSISTVKQTLTSLHAGQYRIYDVEEDSRIDEFVESKTHRAYNRGEAYYQLMKRETIQPSKKIAIFEGAPKWKVYIGTADESRQLLGLPDGEYVDVKPENFRDYEIFIQSTSNNRKLIAGTKLLILS